MSSTKPKSPVWAHFIEVKSGDNEEIVHLKCIYCNALYKPHATRLAKHLLQQCNKIPQGIKSSLKSSLENVNLSTKSNSSTSSVTHVTPRSIENMKTNDKIFVSGPMSNFVDLMTEEENVSKFQL